MKYVEQRVKYCKACGRATLQHRNARKLGAAGWVINLVLVLVTSGLWLIVMLFGWLLNVRIGGWVCAGCK